MQLEAEVDAEGDVAFGSHAMQADDALGEYVFAGQVAQAVPRGGENVPAAQVISVETLGQAEPRAHGRQEMGVLEMLFCT